MKKLLANDTATQLLNAIGENIFITDDDYTIVFANKYVDTLVEAISPFTGLDSREDYIGLSMDQFHEGSLAERVRKTLDNYTLWPYETTISLFDKFTARLSISPFELEGERKGMVVTWKDLTRFEEEMSRDHYKLEELYTTVMETVVDGCLLVPIAGTIDFPRIASMKTTILDEVEKRKASTVVVDFSGFNNFDDPSLLEHFYELKRALLLLGTELILCGISAKVAGEIAKYPSTNTGLKIFSDFRKAMYAVFHCEGLELVKTK